MNQNPATNPVLTAINESLALWMPPPTGMVYGMDGWSRSWVPVVTRWEVQCIVHELMGGFLQDAPADGHRYVRDGFTQEWINIEDLDFDDGEY